MAHPGRSGSAEQRRRGLPGTRARSWCQCARSAWATAPTSWCVSASAAAPAAARALRTTSAWPAYWALGPSDRPRAPGPSASPAADPRATKRSPSWTSIAPGEPWTVSRPPPVAAWAEGSLQGFADWTLTDSSSCLGLSRRVPLASGLSQGRRPQSREAPAGE